MKGITIFHSLAEALRAGFHVYERTATGYTVRTRTAAGWAFALVVLREHQSDLADPYAVVGDPYAVPQVTR